MDYFYEVIEENLVIAFFLKKLNRSQKKISLKEKSCITSRKIKHFTECYGLILTGHRGKFS